MRDELLKFFGPQERKLTVSGVPVVVKTIPDDADVAALKDGQDVLWKMLVRCAFGADGKPEFTDEDIETLKRAPRVLTLPLVQAVQDVNGFDLYADVKNSAADPSAG